jgi:hypothetical protein
MKKRNKFKVGYGWRWHLANILDRIFKDWCWIELACWSFNGSNHNWESRKNQTCIKEKFAYCGKCENKIKELNSDKKSTR